MISESPGTYLRQNHFDMTTQLTPSATKHNEQYLVLYSIANSLTYLSLKVMPSIPNRLMEMVVVLESLKNHFNSNIYSRSPCSSKLVSKVLLSAKKNTI